MLWLIPFLVLILWLVFCFFFFKQKTAYEMRISDWSSDVCSSDLHVPPQRPTINCAINLWIRCGSLLREILTSRGVAAPDTHIFMSASRSKVPAVSNEKRVTERHGMLRNS